MRLAVVTDRSYRGFVTASISTGSRHPSRPPAAPSASLPPPSFDDVLTWYASPRQLRTRATGTMFTVRSQGGQLVVIPSSGFGRGISRDEFRNAWPHMERDEPRSKWQHLSNNTSYLEAIHDEVAEELQAFDPLPSTQAVPAIGPSSDPGVADWEVRYRNQRRQFAEAYRKLQAEVARRDQAGIELARSVRQKDGELSESATHGVLGAAEGRRRTAPRRSREQARVCQRGTRRPPTCSEHAHRAMGPQGERLRADVVGLREKLALMSSGLARATKELAEG